MEKLPAVSCQELPNDREWVRLVQALKMPMGWVPCRISKILLTTRAKNESIIGSISMFAPVDDMFNRRWLNET